MTELDDFVKSVIEKEKNAKIEAIKEDVYNFIKENNGTCDLVDISCNFKNYTVDIPSMAATQLVESGRVERRELYGCRCAYFIK